MHWIQRGLDRIRIPRRFNVGDCVSVLGGTVAGRVLDGAQCPVGHESLETGRKRLVGRRHAPRTCSRLNGEGGGCAAVHAKPSGAGPARPCTPGPCFPSPGVADLTALPCRDGLCLPPAVLPHQEAGLCRLHAGPPGRDPARAQETAEQAALP